MNTLVRSHSSKGICFLAIYIAEAHARDQWPVGKTISCVDQPKTLEQRLKYARKFQENFGLIMPMLVDNMENNFHLTYGSWPFRFFIIFQNQLILKAQPDEQDFTYHINEIDSWIEQFSQ